MQNGCTDGQAEENQTIADIAATVVTFFFSLILGNASVYDPYWSVQPIVILIAFSMNTELTPLRLLLLVAVCFWGVRLTANWAYTFHGLKHQDWRYTMLSEKTGAFYPAINFLGIHLVPTLIVYGCILPAVYAMIYDAGLNIGKQIEPPIVGQGFINSNSDKSGKYVNCYDDNKTQYTVFLHFLSHNLTPCRRTKPILQGSIKYIFQFNLN